MPGDTYTYSGTTPWKGRERPTRDDMIRGEDMKPNDPMFTNPALSKGYGGRKDRGRNTHGQKPVSETVVARLTAVLRGAGISGLSAEETARRVGVSPYSIRDIMTRVGWPFYEGDDGRMYLGEVGE